MDIAGAAALMPASRDLAIDKGELYRLVTSLLVHGDLGHLLSNSFLFFTLGYFLYGYFGFWVFPGAAFLGGAITSFFSLLTYGSYTQLIGASGIVFWMGGAWLTLYLLINRQRSLFSRFLRVLGVTLALFMPAEAFDPAVSYRAHFIGFFVGIFWALGYFIIKRDLFRSAEVIEVAIEETDIEAEIKSKAVASLVIF